jgi:uncharacterized protein (TIGR02147 family)
MKYVFDFHDYKTFLHHHEQHRTSLQRGFRSRLAETLPCQNAYISQVMNGGANFSPEQGLKIAEFIKLNAAESRYFVVLIEHARAGTRELREFHQRDLDEMREKFLNLATRVSATHTLSMEQQSVYYSSWLFMTVHLMTTISGYRTIAKIAEALGMNEDVIRDAVLFLLEMQLLEEKSGHLVPGPTQLHLSKDSPLVHQHHTNWRVNSIRQLTDNNKNNLHYSTISSLSRADAEKLRSRFIQVIQEYVETIRPSREETLYNFNLDFYCLVK